MTLLTAEVQREEAEADETTLYGYDQPYGWRDDRAVFIPYFAWANRGEGEMRVWIRSDD